MKVKPVKRYPAPGYPTQEILRDHPELLRLIPKRWRHNRTVLTALGAAAILISLAQCSNDRGTQSAKAATRVAPIFVHGDGRGSFGCVAVAAPVFLSEEEAFQIVQDEASKASLNFVRDDLTIQKAQMPWDDSAINSAIDSDKVSPNTDIDNEGGLFVFDGYDHNRDIAYEFVSYADYHKPRRRAVGSAAGSMPEIRSTAWVEDYKRTAQQARDSLQLLKIPSVSGVFYDPAESEYSVTRKIRQENGPYVKRYFLSDEEVRQYNEEQLRVQVRDFIQWLKAEGII